MNGKGGYDDDDKYYNKIVKGIYSSHTSSSYRFYEGLPNIAPTKGTVVGIF